MTIIPPLTERPDLVRLAGSIPEDEVIELLPVVFGNVDEPAQGDDSGAYLRRKSGGTPS